MTCSICIFWRCPTKEREAFPCPIGTCVIGGLGDGSSDCAANETCNKWEAAK